MFSGIRGRILVILIAIGLAVGSLITHKQRTATEDQPGRWINLGLDLQGGMHLALEVSDPNGTMTPEQRRDATDQNVNVLRNRIDQFGVAEPLVQKSGDERIIVELPGVSDPERAKGVIQSQAFLEWQLVQPTEDFTRVANRLDRTIAEQLGPEDLEAVTDTTSPDSALASRQAIEEALFGRDTTAADSAAGDTTATDSAGAAAPTTPSQRPLTSLLFASGRAGEFLVAEQDVPRVKRYLALPRVLEQLPRGTELVWSSTAEGGGGQDLYRSLYLLEREPFITGDRLRNATAGRDPQFNKTIVTFELDRRGGRTFDDITSQHIGDRIAIVLDTLVHSAPIVESRIGATGQIDLQQAPMQEASDLALVLRAGALPAPLEIVEERTVGPSLGRDSIDQGKIAGVIGIILVVGIMVVYYRMAGAMAVVALSIFVLLLLGGLAGLGATLTAPGIAGIVLSVGMAVDANVLIFERIREELLNGRSTRAAVDEGFRHAMSAIVDSNITTLITALILYQIGTGPVRGFAVTLSMGIIASFFTAVYITRTFFLIYLDRKRPADPISI
jgi:preprotein translocase subunit SecD